MIAFNTTLQIGPVILEFRIGSEGLRAFLHVLGAKRIHATLIKGYLEKEERDIRVASVTGVMIFKPGERIDRRWIDETPSWCMAWGVHFAEGEKLPHIWKLTLPKINLWLMLTMAMFVSSCSPERPILSEYSRARLAEGRLRDIPRSETSIGETTTITGPVLVGPGGMTIILPAGATLYFLHVACPSELVKIQKREVENVWR